MSEQSEHANSPGRILIADDEPHIRRVLLTLLHSASYEVREAVDGRDAMTQLDGETPFDFILLDLMMPYASGIEVLEHIRENDLYDDTPVIILTAKGQDADRDAALARGANDFMTKPFSPKKLLLRIQEILAGR